MTDQIYWVFTLALALGMYVVGFLEGKRKLKKSVNALGER